MRPRYQLSILIASTTLSTMWSGAGLAHAGRYVIRSCNVPAQRSAPAAPWTWTNAPGTYANDECGSGGGFGLNAGPMERATAAAVVLGVPNEGAAATIRIRQVRLWSVARLRGAGSALFVAWSSGGPTGTTASGNLFGPPGADTLTTPFVTPVLPSDTRVFVLVLSCSGSAPEGCAPESANPLEVRGAEVTLEEDVAPGGTVDGELFAGGVQAGIRGLQYSVDDLQSGVAQVSAMLGTTVVATREFSGDCAQSGFAACETHRSGTLPIDTRKVPNGNYPVSLRVTDVAGNREVVLAPAAIQVMNSQTTLANGNGATGAARMAAAFAGRRGSVITAPFRRRVTVRGRLTTDAGAGIGSARVEVIENPVFGLGAATQRTTTTRANGTFSFRIAARGMSRSLVLRYRPVLSDPSVAANVRLRLKVAAAGSLRVGLRGTRVSYGGRVASKPLPRGGKLIHIQGRAAGGAWTTFATKRTNGSGAFSGSYRLRVRRPGVRLQFRFRIPEEPRYPYAAGTGPVVTRVVR